MDAPLGRWQSELGKSLTAIAQGCYELYKTNPEAKSHKTAAVGPPTSQIRQTRHAGHWCRSKDILLWIPSHGVVRPARTYQHQICTDTGCSLEDLPEAMNDRDRWRERERELGESVFTARHDNENYYNSPWEFYPRVKADDLSLEFEW